MKILMFSTDPNAMISGSPTQLRLQEYVKELPAEMHVVVGIKGRDTPRAIGDLHFYPVSKSTSLVGRLRFYRWGKFVLQKHSIGLITAQSPDEIGFIAWSLARKFNIPLQLQFHADYFSRYYRRGLKGSVRYVLARFLLPRARCFRVVSRRIKTSLMKRGVPEERIQVLPIFTDVEKFLRAGKGSNGGSRFRAYTFKMIAVGRFFDEEKNFSMLIRMMPGVLKQEPRALLVIAGDGPDRAMYQQLISSLDLEKNVILEPWHSDLANFYQSFDVFCMPSNFEGWGLAAAEAMAAGLPVVMTDVGLAGEVLRDGEEGIVVSVQDTRAFSQAVISLCKDKKKRKKMGALGKERVSTLMKKEEYLQKMKESFIRCM